MRLVGPSLLIELEPGLFIRPLAQTVMMGPFAVLQGRSLGPPACGIVARSVRMNTMPSPNVSIVAPIYI